MRHYILSVMLMLALPLWASNKTEKQDSLFVSTVLKEATVKKNIGNISLFFARKFIGRPYVAHTLEQPGNERLVVNTRQLDCTTLVENVTALTLCVQHKKFTYAEFKKNLVALRYTGGIINGYPSRLHYFTSWIVDNEKLGYVREIQAPMPPFIAIQTIKVNYMSLHPSAYLQLKDNEDFVAEIKKSEQAINGMKFRYIPKNIVYKKVLLRKAVKDGDIIAITCKKKGLDIAHLGFASWKRDGLHLLNASMIHKKVVDEPMTLYKYLQQHPSHTGIRIIRINNNK